LLRLAKLYLEESQCAPQHLIRRIAGLVPQLAEKISNLNGHID
jgi:hypothetical protein